MGYDKAVDGAKLDADILSIAEAIRTKGGTDAPLEFPAEFVSAIQAIQAGGGTPTSGPRFIDETIYTHPEDWVTNEPGKGNTYEFAKAYLNWGKNISGDLYIAQVTNNAISSNRTAKIAVSWKPSVSVLSGFGIRGSQNNSGDWRYINGSQDFFVTAGSKIRVLHYSMEEA